MLGLMAGLSSLAAPAATAAGGGWLGAAGAGVLSALQGMGKGYVGRGEGGWSDLGALLSRIQVGGKNWSVGGQGGGGMQRDLMRMLTAPRRAPQSQQSQGVVNVGSSEVPDMTTLLRSFRMSDSEFPMWQGLSPTYQ